MNNFFRKFWGLIPITLWLIIALMLFAICRLTGWGVRTAPKAILYFLFLVSFLALQVWICVKLFRLKRDSCVMKAFAAAVSLVSLIVFALMCWLGTLTFLFAVGLPETVVEKYGITMLRREMTVSVETDYDYYEYKGVLFYGKQLGHEDTFDGRPPASWYFRDPDGNLLDASEDYAG